MSHALSRRSLFGVAAVTAATLTAAGCRTSTDTADIELPPHPDVVPESSRPQISDPVAALAELEAGNERFATAQMQHPDQDPARRMALADSQSPFAVVLSCSDSRLPPELIYDQGLGDLFVVRVAGNIVDPAVLGSIEYAVGHLHTPLIVVLGHQGCGAVKATIDALETHDEPHGDVAALIAAIKPAVADAVTEPGDLVTNTIRANAIRSRDEVSASAQLADPIADGTLQVRAGYYNLETGLVELI